MNSCLLRNLSPYHGTGKSFFLQVQVKLLFGLTISITKAVNLVIELILENLLYYSDFYHILTSIS